MGKAAYAFLLGAGILAAVSAYGIQRYFSKTHVPEFFELRQRAETVEQLADTPLDALAEAHSTILCVEDALRKRGAVIDSAAAQQMRYLRRDIECVATMIEGGAQTESRKLAEQKADQLRRLGDAYTRKKADCVLGFACGLGALLTAGMGLGEAGRKD